MADDRSSGLGTLPSSFGLFEAVASHVEFQYDAVVDQAVNGRRGRHRVLEDALPFREGQVARDHDAPSFVTLGEQRE